MPANLFVRYLIIGGGAYLIEMASLYSLRSGLGLSPVKAVAISFWIGFVVAFVLQKLATFKNYDRRAHAITRQIAGYSLLVAWNYAFTLTVVKFLGSHISVYLIRSGVILTVTSWNFLAYTKIFKLSDSTETIHEK